MRASAECCCRCALKPAASMARTLLAAAAAVPAALLSFLLLLESAAAAAGCPDGSLPCYVVGDYWPLKVHRAFINIAVACIPADCAQPPLTAGQR